MCNVGLITHNLKTRTQKISKITEKETILGYSFSITCLFQCKQKIHVKAWVPRACLGQYKDGNQCRPEKSQVS